MEKIELVSVTQENWDDICGLYPGEDGEDYVAPNSYSITQSFFEKNWVCRGITADGRLIGFAMYGLTDDEVHGYEIIRYMMDENEQGKGYGQRALKAVIDEMIQTYKCDKIYTSTAPANVRAIHVYEKAGFVPTGESCGEGEYAEDIFVLTL